MVGISGYFRLGESTEQYPHTGASLAPNGINQKIGFVSTEGYPHLKLPLPFMCLTGNRKGAKSKQCHLIQSYKTSKSPENQNFIIPVKNGNYLHFPQPRLHNPHLLSKNKITHIVDRVINRFSETMNHC